MSVGAVLNILNVMAGLRTAEGEMTCGVDRRSAYLGERGNLWLDFPSTPKVIFVSA